MKKFRITDSIRTVEITINERNDLESITATEIILGKDLQWPYSEKNQVYVVFYVDLILRWLADAEIDFEIEELPVIGRRNLTDIFPDTY